MNNSDINDPAVLRLIAGYKQFRKKHFEDIKTFDDLVQNGQSPNTLVIACSDSRVDPAILTNCDPGELFVVRNIANLVPPFEGDSKHHSTSAALEYGVLSLEVSNIIVLGHSYCGGIRALMEAPENEKPSDFLDTWIDIAKPAKERVLRQRTDSSLDKQTNQCEKESLLISLKNLTTFPWINERVLKGKLFLHAWYFDLETGMMEGYQPATGDFIPLGEETPE